MSESGKEYVFLRFEGKKTDANGLKNKYKIIIANNQKIKDEILSYSRDFMEEEPTNKALGSKHSSHPEKCREMWTEWLTEDYSVACYRTDVSDQSKLVGFNINFIQRLPFDIDKISEYSPKSMQAQLEALMKLKSEIDFKQKFGVNKYLDAMGLYVLPEYRGDGIGIHLLEARKLICKHSGIKVTANSFSSVAARKQAEKVGFKVFSEMKMKDYKTVYGLDIDCAEDDIIKFMGMVVD